MTHFDRLRHNLPQRDLTRIEKAWPHGFGPTEAVSHGDACLPVRASSPLFSGSALPMLRYDQLSYTRK
jgi:hypothetical protein